MNLGAYSGIVRAKAAYRFDIGALLMRLLTYTITIGTITTLTLAGASALAATSVSSLIAVCMIFVAPRVSRRIDKYGQSAVVPGATVIAVAGLALMLATTFFGWPFWLNYLAAPFISFLPNAQAMVRTRWAYLIQTGRLGEDPPLLKTAYAYEGILEDLAFMVGPAAVIALAAAITPIAGMLVGTIAYCVGAVLLVSSRDTEPEPGWGTSHHERGSGKGVLRTSPAVRVIFVAMILFGAMYGALDTSIVSYCQEIDLAAFASVVLVAESAVSVVMSVMFGMVSIARSLRQQFVVFLALFGGLYALFAFVGSLVSLIAISCVAGVAYAPMYITTSVTCQSAVPPANLTEALSWLVSGTSIGMVVGPVLAGAVVDAWGGLAGFSVVTAFALCLVAVAFGCIPVLRKYL